MNQQEALFNYLLRLGDTAVIHGHRLSEWCSRGPILEEDLALTNTALDYIGRAEALLKYAADMEGKGRTEDDIVYKRGERHYYNALLVELPRGDYADTVARQLLLSVAEFHLFSALCNSSDTTLAGIAAKSVKEIRYHLSHAKDWCLRFGLGTAESKEKLQAAFNHLWMFTGELFEQLPSDNLLSQAGILPDLSNLKSLWTAMVNDVLTQCSITIPQDGYMQTGGMSKAIHTEHLGHLLSEMQYLQRAYPEATW
ncbi:MAG TPA: phenylacetate-CoA oxygenase subunit PaaC [Chitinophagaceae bacterium]|nr:phenylacetate-CoA oxygenase subunit PaaC [Chitinophagaceae bacterium]